jgi:hypothetical protein
LGGVLTGLACYLLPLHGQVLPLLLIVVLLLPRLLGLALLLLDFAHDIIELAVLAFLNVLLQLLVVRDPVLLDG